MASWRRGWCPARVEALEGRALLAASPIVPTFNRAQVVATPVGDSTTALSQPTAVAVQSDGRIVVVGSNDVSTDLSNPTKTPSTLYVVRYNPDGTLDSTFGTGGQATVTLPTVASPVVTPARDLLIQPDGRIVVDATLSTQSASGTTVVGSVVVRLTAAGTPDSTFGTGGEALITTNTPSFQHLALQGDGRIVLAGTALTATSASATTSRTTVVRLNSDGTVDPAFNGGAPVLLAVQANLTTYRATKVYALGVTSAGAIKVVAVGPDAVQQYVVTQLTSTGALDPTFGTGGVVTSTAAQLGLGLYAATITATGQVYITATSSDGTSLTNQIFRLNADGSPDLAFGTPTTAFVGSDVAVGSNGTILLSGTSYFAGGSNLGVQRLLANGTPDTTFGPGGVARVHVPNAVPTTSQGYLGVRQANTITGLAPQPNGTVVVAALSSYAYAISGFFGRDVDYGSQTVVGVLGATNRLLGLSGDYDGDNHADLAAQLTNPGLFALRQSTGGDHLIPFGIPGTGQSVPAPGDYDGDGKTDIAAYLPSLGILAYRPSTGGPDVLTRFGPTGLGNAIPVPGDYDGDGRTDVAFFLPGSATFIIDPSSGSAPYAVQFGAGSGLSIPVVGDYDGSGRTELAVYTPVTGGFFFRSATNGRDNADSFGPVGPGASIPFTGDFDGDGLTDLALYLPDSGTLITLDSSGNGLGGPVATQFGAPGVGQSIPIAGDYNGDGRDDLAVHLPGLGAFAIRPSGGTTAADRIEFFGTGGPATVAVAEPAYLASTSTVAAQALGSSRASAADGLVVYLPDDLPGTTRKKAAATG